MINWLGYLNISHLHRLYEGGHLSIEHLGQAVAARLKASPYFTAGNLEFIEIIDEFESLDQLSDIDDYDSALDLLYDFGDDGHKMWVETIQPLSLPQNSVKTTTLDDKIKQLGLQGKIPDNMYEHIKQADQEYQDWLLERMRRHLDIPRATIEPIKSSAM